ncbi:MAG: acyl carrier protein [Blastopirellula sp.]|nr:MAG: acyl carrier protein [Blastopirellula sp.]
MDRLEMVMDVEEHFGIALTEAELESMETVGNMVEVIQQRIITTRATKCVFLKYYLILRKHVRETTGDTAFQIHPNQEIVDLLSIKQRKLLWKQLSETTDLSLGSLRRPRFMRVTLIVLVAIMVVVSLIPSFYQWEIFPLSVIATVCFGVFLNICTLGFRTEPPTALETFGKITRYMAGLQTATNTTCSAEPDAILEELRPILINVLGVDDTEITPTARFIEDLGVG